MLLSKMLNGIEAQIHEDVEITSIAHDSREVKEGALFVCLPGARADGHNFAYQAAEMGAAALIVERYIDGIELPQALVKSSRHAYAIAAGNLFGNPAADMKMFAVTGTKGKTTTTYLIKAIAEAAGHKVGVLGTAGNMIGDEMIENTLTTPDPGELHALLARMKDADVTLVAMEASAHALELCKLDGITFESAMFTNLKHDHLDFFGTMERYADAKRKLFAAGVCKHSILNIDDEEGAHLKAADANAISFSLSEGAAVYARGMSLSERGSSFELCLPGCSVHVGLNLPGKYNVLNALGAAAACYAAGMPASAVKAGLESVPGVRGRMESVETGCGFSAIVDYAHTPDSIENVLEAIRGFAKGRIIAVFGCGGERDTLKRPEMGLAAGNGADYAIITSDNPRGEEPLEIIKAIEPGLKQSGCEYEIVGDRKAAIFRAVELAKDGDVIAVLGKGHETYQEIKGVKRHFDDVQELKEALER